MAARNKLICVVLLTVLALGLYDILTNYEQNGCAMTYMYQWPEYLDVPGLPLNVKRAYPQYSLKLYGEGKYAQDSKNMKLRGIPVLFIPGNAGSYKQVRSLGSVALQKATRLSYHFNYFSVDLNEEFSGLYGPVLQQQTEFVHHCIKHILTLYSGRKDPPTTVLLVGHSMWNSLFTTETNLALYCGRKDPPKTVLLVLVGYSMGGLIARALFTLPNFNVDLVHTIITQATPHQTAVVKLDQEINRFYSRVNKYWQENINSSQIQHVTLLSVGGGHRDFQVRTGLTSLEGIVPESRGLSVMTTSIPRVWLSTDHLCVVWCKELVLATKRAIFDMVDKKTKQISTDVAHRMSVFRHHFETHSGTNKASIGSDVVVDFKGAKFEVVEDGKLHISGSFSQGTTHFLFPVKHPYESFVLVASIAHNKGVFVCTEGDTTTCSEGMDVSWRGRLIPPLKSDMRAVHLNLSEFPGAKFVVVKVTIGSRVPVIAEMYSAEDRHVKYIMPGLMAGEETKTVIQSTEAGASFYSISLAELIQPHQAFTARLKPIRCDGVISKDANTTLGLYVPWNKENSFSDSSANQVNSISLKLHTGRPANDDRLPELRAFLYPECQYKVEIQIAYRDMFGQLVRFHIFLLPCFMAINIILVLSFHLKHIYTSKPLESFVWVQSSYCKPYIVVPPIALFRSLFKYDPLDTTFDLRTIEDRNMSYGPLPLLMFLFAYAIICVIASITSVQLNLFSRIIGVFRKSKSDPAKSGDSVTPEEPKSGDSVTPEEPKSGDSVTPKEPKSGDSVTPEEPKSGDSVTPKEPKSGDSVTPEEPKSGDSVTPEEPKSGDSVTPEEPKSGDLVTPKEPKSGDSVTPEEPKCMPESSLYSSICISGLLLALGFGTCGEIALLGALVVYFFRVVNLHGKPAFYYHSTILLLLWMLVILNAPSLLVWTKNLRYSMQLSSDPALYPSIIVCVTLVALLNTKYTVPKMRSLATAGSWTLYFLCILMVLYASDSMYRLSYFISAVFAVLAFIQVAQ